MMLLCVLARLVSKDSWSFDMLLLLHWLLLVRAIIAV